MRSSCVSASFLAVGVVAVLAGVFSFPEIPSVSLRSEEQEQVDRVQLLPGFGSEPPEDIFVEELVTLERSTVLEETTTTTGYLLRFPENNLDLDLEYLDPEVVPVNPFDVPAAAEKVKREVGTDEHQNGSIITATTTQSTSKVTQAGANNDNSTGEVTTTATLSSSTQDNAQDKSSAKNSRFTEDSSLIQTTNASAETTIHATVSKNMSSDNLTTTTTILPGMSSSNVSTITSTTPAPNFQNPEPKNKFTFINLQGDPPETTPKNEPALKSYNITRTTRRHHYPTRSPIIFLDLPSGEVSGTGLPPETTTPVANKTENLTTPPPEQDDTATEQMEEATLQARSGQVEVPSTTEEWLPTAVFKDDPRLIGHPDVYIMDDYEVYRKKLGDAAG